MSTVIIAFNMCSNGVIILVSVLSLKRLNYDVCAKYIQEHSIRTFSSSGVIFGGGRLKLMMRDEIPKEFGFGIKQYIFDLPLAPQFLLSNYAIGFEWIVLINNKPYV